MEDNFALAMTVFVIGFVATLSTMIYIAVVHRRSERQWTSGDPYADRDRPGGVSSGEPT